MPVRASEAGQLGGQIPEHRADRGGRRALGEESPGGQHGVAAGPVVRHERRHLEAGVTVERLRELSLRVWPDRSASNSVEHDPDVSGRNDLSQVADAADNRRHRQLRTQTVVIVSIGRIVWRPADVTRSLRPKRMHT